MTKVALTTMAAMTAAWAIAWFLLLGVLSPPARAQSVSKYESSPGAVQVGHWLEVRGTWNREEREDSEKLLVASRIEILAPQGDELLIGTVSRERFRDGRFRLLGQPVETSEKTEWEGVDPRRLPGLRVKVEGHYRGPAKFSAREIEPRGPGRDRISGRVDRIRAGADGLHLEIMRFTVVVPSGLSIEHERPLAELALAPMAAAGNRSAAQVGDDEDDLFGDGLLLASNLRFDAQVELRVAGEENFDLDREDPEDRIDNDGSLRARLEWEPSSRVAVVGEWAAGRRYRDDQEDGTSTAQTQRLGETYVYLKDPFRLGLDLQLGRQDFDEKREWLYDQNLDGLRLIGAWKTLRVELSATTSLSDASDRDLEATNFIAYLSNRDRRRQLATYVIHRDFDTTAGERTTHLGVRALGNWLPQNKSWIEVALLDGRLDGLEIQGHAVDLGSTWSPDFATPYSFTLGYAFGSGDRGTSDGEDRTFRQTGLADNNGKFAGVTSFRYYGELLDPELGNLHIMTVAFGTALGPGTSLDLVFHNYRQAEAVDRLLETELDQRPDGVHTDLGWEIDAILGWRRFQQWDLEVVGAYFAPGSAFPAADDALLAKLQLRYRL